jgi:uncharacterized membrane protein (UPF0182 family)
VVLLVAGLPLSHLWLDAQWFGSVGQSQVFVLRLTTTLLFGLVAALIAFGWIAAIWIAAFARVRLPWRQRSVNVAVALGALLIAVLFGLAASAVAPDYLTWSRQVPFQLADPVFGQDISFYVFTLPLLESAQGWVLWLLIVTLVGLVVPLGIAGQWVDVSALQRQLVPNELENLYTFPRKVSILPRSPLVRLTCGVGALFMLVLAWGRWLDVWELVYSNRGAVFGASRTDLAAELPVIYLLIGLAVVGCVALVAVAGVRPSPWPVLLVPGAYLALSVALLGIWPALYEGLYVRPNQLGQEEPFIANNIAMTRDAFKLDGIDEQALQGNGALTPQDLQNNAATLSDLRITDQQALLAAYQQTQRLRQYYDFKTVSVDRYPLMDGTAQVMLSPREMDVTNLPAVARTWQNDHLVYTHGQGVAASRVNAVDGQGLPQLLVRDLPPQSDEPMLAIDQPQIYYGQEDALYAVVGTSIQEFDRPGAPGEPSEVYANYQGSEGIPVGDAPQRAALALALGDGNLLLSNAVLPSSHILLHRLIVDRVQTLAPFLRLDSDPYMVVLGGKLIWVIDAYTWSDRFPDATPEGSLNYVRNSLKVTVNAYDGTVHFYVVDPSDPIVQTYERIYPSLFEPVSDAPTDLPPHFRYPDDLLALQAQAYATYHMTDPRTFYNREDLWNIASEVSGGRAQQMSPYYVRMQLPGEPSVEFTSILPFTPSGQDRTNMVAWMAARSDPPHYGELRVYRFPANSFVYGPQQIGARINQEPTISSQLTLWSQQGSSVIMGNLLVIPLQDSPLYVEPLYIRAQNNPLPQLQRVIVASTQAVVMSDTLPSALQALAAGKHGEVLSTPAAEAPAAAPAARSGGTSQDLARQALQTYQDAVAAQRQGDWATYGQKLDQLQDLLEQLNQGAPSQ